MARILLAALLLLFTLPAVAQTPGDSIAFVTADWHTTDLGRGATARVKPQAAWAKPPTPQQPSTAAIST